MAEEIVPTTEQAPAADVSTKIKGGRKKKSKAKVTKGRMYITATYNNTIISVTDPVGNVLAWGSSGKTGFKGSKKSTPYAGQRTMEDLLTRVKDRGLVEVDVFIKGVGSSRESAVRALQGSGMNVLSIKDQTPVAHGGVRHKKVRRI
ncbi:MAG: 30S ribosomal protein S11 [Candidatus Doudnabacteria bacterium]|nr:30S ribosomal protein S11 [Candidatus Doudnabacteria bacterium]